MQSLFKRLGPYLDDLLLIAGGVCFVAAAAVSRGVGAALAVAGAHLTLLAFVTARGERGGDGDAASPGDPGGGDAGDSDA